MEIVVSLLVILVIVFSVFNIIMAIKRNKNKYVVFNGVFYGIIALLFVFYNVNKAVISHDSENYDIHSGSILSSVRYDRTEGDYYILKNSGIFLSDSIAVPKENTDISFITEIYKPVHIYCIKDTRLFDSQIEINTRKYNLGDTVVKIVPDFSDLFLIVGFIDLFVIVVYNLVLFIINGISLYTEKQES